MPQSALTAEQLQVLSTFGWGAAFLLAWLVHWLSRKLDKGCPSCAHCQRNRDAEEAKDRATRERLFGKQVSDDEDETPKT